MRDQSQTDQTLNQDPPPAVVPTTLSDGQPPVPAPEAIDNTADPGSVDAPNDAPLTRLTAGTGPIVNARPSSVFPVIPGYEIVRELGRGGMGVVYHAMQTRLNRPVALKMILSGAHAGAGHLARFQIEAETLAGLQHPNIVQLYEIGEHDHCPYLAMEYLEGEPLDHYLSGKPLPFDVSARLIETLARAIHCAHQRGIVHRDLKPGNVLLQGSGVRSGTTATTVVRGPSPDLWCPKLLDFGLAKRLEGESLTCDGSVMGTPSYMAPEQALGKIREIGPATDVYALGAILYECLTGKTPFVGNTAMQTLMRVQNEEPVAPSRLRPRLPRDLEVICLKCMQKDPRKRDVSAEALADDLNAFLTGKPITARPVGVWERSWKWARRRPTAAALIGVSVAALIGFVGIGVWYNSRLRVANVNLKAARDRAEERSRLVRTAVDEMYTQVAEKWLGNEPHMDDLQEQFLNKARRLYEELARDESDDPVLQAETARAWYRVGEIYRKLNKFTEAEQAYKTAIAADERLTHRVPSEPQYRFDLADDHTGLGELLRAQGHPDKAAESYTQALELQHALVHDFPEEPNYQKEEARAYYNLGLARKELIDFQAAVAAMKSAIDLLEPLVRRDGKNRSYRQELARVFLNLGTVRAKLRDNAGAAAADGEAIQLQRELTKDDPKRPDYRYELAVSLNNLGNLHQHQNQPAKAQANHEEARELLERLTLNFPARPLYRKELANTCNSLAAVLWRTQPQKAADLWEKSEHEFRRLAESWKNVPDYSLGQGQAMGNRGWVLMEQLHDPAAALEPLKQAVKILEDACDANLDNHILLGQYLNLSDCLLRLEDYDGVERVLRKLFNVEPPPLVPERFLAARLLAQSKRTADADWAVRVLKDLDPAKLSADQRTLHDPKFDGIRKRADVQELVRRWQKKAE